MPARDNQPLPHSTATVESPLQGLYSHRRRIIPAWLRDTVHGPLQPPARGGMRRASFAQANAVKSVPHLKKGMKFGQVEKISSGAEDLVAEIQQIRPSVIILQGRDLHPTLMNEFIRLGHSADRISAPLPLWRVSWKFRLPLESYLAAFFHPAHGWLERQWKPVIQPAMKELLNKVRRNQSFQLPFST
jgi:hypothetical protein